ncbi:MAG: hypothetical protein HYT64_02215 [Candidatus Yanofskybacteria bacterium]|nr:hypothetical protein [Candidatus Yanofskybacteria bacterium]
MARLTPISWKDFEKFLLFSGLKRPLVVPVYDEIPMFVIRNNLRILGMTVEEYLEILKQL